MNLKMIFLILQIPLYFASGQECKTYAGICQNRITENGYHNFPDQAQCLQKCQENSKNGQNCIFYSYNFLNGECYLYDTCVSVVSSCYGCQNIRTFYRPSCEIGKSYKNMGLSGSQ